MKILIAILVLLSVSLFADIDIVSENEALPKILILNTQEMNCPTNKLDKFDKSFSFDMKIIPYFNLINGNYKDNDIKKFKKMGIEYVFSNSCVMKNKKMNITTKIFSIIKQDYIYQKTYKESYNYPHKLAHFIVNDLYKYFSSGNKGIFLSQIVYAKKVRGKKQIFTMGVDGTNIKQITKNRSINILPAWWGSNKLLFTSYLMGTSDLYFYDFNNSRIKLLSSRKGLNIGASSSPDGEKIALTLSKDGNSEIYLINKKGKILKRLTNNKALDTSPNWSPDGKKITFVSNRHGNPHIFIMNSDGSNKKRLTFQGIYNQSPRWSPKGDRILFTARDEKNKFDIFYIDLNNNNQIIRLTQGMGNNEEASYSPDGEFIVFLSSMTGTYQIYIMDKNGKRITKVTNSKSSYYTPKWSLK